MKLPWVLNTSGKPDAMLTLAIVGFSVVLVKVLFEGFSFTVASKSFSLGAIDAASIAAILTPTLGAYVGRRWTDKSLVSAQEEKDVPQQV